MIFLLLKGLAFEFEIVVHISLILQIEHRKVKRFHVISISEFIIAQLYGNNDRMLSMTLLDLAEAMSAKVLESITMTRLESVVFIWHNQLIFLF